MKDDLGSESLGVRCFSLFGDLDHICSGGWQSYMMWVAKPTPAGKLTEVQAESQLPEEEKHEESCVCLVFCSVCAIGAGQLTRRQQDRWRLEGGP